MRCSSRSVNAFRFISEALSHPQNAEEAAPHYDHIFKLFGLDRVSASLVALLICRRIGEEDPTEARRTLNLSDEVFSKAWDDLAFKGFITVRTYRYLFTITEAFRIAIEEDKPLGEVQERLQGDRFLEALKAILPAKGRTVISRRMLEIQELDDDELDDDALVDEAPPVPDLTEDSLLKTVESSLALFPKTRLSLLMASLTEGLSGRERLALYGMMAWFTEHFIEPVKESAFPYPMEKAYRESLSTLLQKGLAVSFFIWNESEHTTSSDNYRISPRCAEAFKGRENLINTAALSRFGELTPCSMIAPKELYFPESDQRSLQRIRLAVRPSEYDRIIEGLKEHGLRPCLSILMWGPPGTGKTELTRQIARESGRALLSVKADNMNGIYIGEGSIHFRDLFNSYRYVCAMSKVCPILFLDEADGVLSQRLTSMRGIGDKDANATQSVILDELNTLPGIVIATTNLRENLDEATLRRFLILSEFHVPDSRTRARLWLGRFPSLTPEEAGSIAERYPIAGALMDDIVGVAVLDGVLENRPVTAEDIASYCEERGLKSSRERLKIGFRTGGPCS